MRLDEIYSNSARVPISYEVFPPKNDNDGTKTKNLLSEIEKLKKFEPKLISVTYGAGGTNQEKSIDLVKQLMLYGYNVMPHFTCVNSTREFVSKYLLEIEDMGIENILALRGDIPAGMEHSIFEFKHASDLAEFIHSKVNISIGVAGYPEKHIDCDTLENDIKNLKNKVDKGADVVFTQLFFDNNAFFDFEKKIKKAGIIKPVVAGIMPLLSYKSIDRITSMSNTKIPDELYSKMKKYKDDLAATTEIGIEYAINQCQDLMDNGVSGLHFYTLNKSYATTKILENIL